MQYTPKQVRMLIELERKQREASLRKPGSYLSTKKESGEPRENGAARQFERYGWF